MQTNSHCGYDAKISAAAAQCPEQVFIATAFGIPVSTTHTITGAIVGVGSVTKLRGIRWGLATRIVYAWIFTIPAAASVGALTMWLAHMLNAY